MLSTYAWYVTEPGFEPVNAFIGSIISTLFLLLSLLKNRKSSNNNNATNSDFHITNEITINQFQESLRLKSQIQQYDRHQFNSYYEIWKVLQNLRACADDLWNEVSKRNMINYVNSLENVKRVILEKAIFIDESHYQKLNNLLRNFQLYQQGKDWLLFVYERAKHGDIEEWDNETAKQIKKRIDKNRELKAKYESLLDEILSYFRNKLSGTN
jgi:hypothetical protein